MATVPPGVDLSVFTPGDGQAARRRLGLAPSAHVLLFVGRIQPLKAPDLLLRAAAHLLEQNPALRDELVVAVVGGPSGSGLAHPHHLEALARQLGIADVVRFAPPVAQADLVDWYRAADVTVVPSYNESFGLVAIESQAVGTPVVAASVGGLRTAVSDGVSGVLIDGHDPQHYAAVLGAASSPSRGVARRLSAGAVRHAAEFGWDATARGHARRSTRTRWRRVSSSARRPDAQECGRGRGGDGSSRHWVSSTSPSRSRRQERSSPCCPASRSCARRCHWSSARTA